jgi:hypothetical protein
VKTRATFERGIGSARGSAEHAGWNTGRFGAWVFAHRRILQVSTVIAGGLILMFWTQPTVSVVVWLALAVVLALVLIEFLSTPPLEPVTTGAAQEPTLAMPRQAPPPPAEETETTPAIPTHSTSPAPKP